jgi:hypothetical protein
MLPHLHNNPRCINNHSTPCDCAPLLSRRRCLLQHHWTAVHAAAAKGHLDILELLLARGADPLKRE